VREYYQRRFKYVCIDEYQDTNRAQLELAILISGYYKNLMVVGDEDQSIYKFRGATIDNILTFDKTFPDAKVIKLEQNYRSTCNILNAANTVIKNNNSRIGKNLWSGLGDGEKIVVRNLTNQLDEGKYITNVISTAIINCGVKYSDFAILYRMNAQSNALEQVFARSGIPYRVLGGHRFYERKEIKDVLAYLCVINNHCDNLRLQRIINEPKRKIGDSTVNAVAELAKFHNESMFDIMQNADKYDSLAKSASKLKEFTRLILGLREIAESEKLDVLIDKVLDLTGYRAMLKAAAEDEGETRLENVGELISNAVEFTENREDASLNSFLEEVALVADIDNYDPEAEAVVLMTVHSAKGLEFPIVFLPGLEESIFPSQQSSYEPAELEEERRLAYVAVTRAKEKLYLTHTKERLMYGKTQYNKLSRFVSEIPSELLDLPKINDTQSSMGNYGRIITPLNKPKPRISSELNKKPFAGVGTGGKQLETFTVGDIVEHPMFGIGMITSAQRLGPDTMYEIAFDNVGTKKMMATYAKIKRHEG
jgi:DNA helicase-2/ATP-dependent DNA helicase PcrA